LPTPHELFVEDALSEDALSVLASAELVLHSAGFAVLWFLPA